MPDTPLYGLPYGLNDISRVLADTDNQQSLAIELIGNLAPALVGQGFYTATDMNGSAGSGRSANISVGKAIVGSAGNERYQKLASIKNVAPLPDVDGTYYVYLTQQLDTDGSPLYTVSTSSTPPTDTILAFTYIASGGTAGSFNNLPAGRVNLGSLALQSYVQSYAQGLDWKQSVRAATTANTTLSGAQTIDGVSVVAGDRVLVKNQSTGSQNGVYVCASGAWTRATDADVDSELTASTLVPVDEGTANGDSVWILTTNNPIVVGTTALTFAQFPASGTYQLKSEKNAASGYAPLDAGSLLPRTNLTVGPDYLYRNAGTPEGAVTAPVGSVCYDTTTPAIYQKATGSGNTGWVKQKAAQSELLFSNTTIPGGNTVANTASETNFASNYAIPANSLTAGQVIRITAWGVYSTDAVTAGTLTFKVKFGSTVLLATAAVTNVVSVTNQGWKINADLIIDTIGASGTVEAQGDLTLFTAAATAARADMINTATITVDTTVSETAQLSVTWSVATASNSIVLREMIVELLG